MAVVLLSRQAKIRHVLPSVIMRAGTSKGLFIHRHHLPDREEDWSAILLAVMGSCPRQIDGMGGATSTTSKVAVISNSARPGIDVDYTFIQVGVGSEAVDLSGNCGNILAGVGPFALDEGLVKAKVGQTEINIHIFNTNTNRTIVETIQVGEDGKFEEDGYFSMGGVKGTASEIKVAFVDPAGSMTGKLFPTGKRQEQLLVSNAPDMEPFYVQVTMCDAANPFVFVESSSMPQIWHDIDRNSDISFDLVESIRCAGAVTMGLAKDISSAHLVRGSPKIAILSPTLTAISTSSNEALKHPADVSIIAYSMGLPHPSFQLTGAVCLSAAIAVPGTVASDLAKKRELIDTPPETPLESWCGEEVDMLVKKMKKQVTIAHGSGEMTTDVEILEKVDGEVVVKSVSVSRTARRLMVGNVLFAL
ncbi:DUF453-domain-containing protein [Mollisia scopiformis]|uniref:DUF453-domain-containing protein n=1 Tax=Mollisia scopiformis TaxID=149040 RepID=A0A194X6U7_MOLSC|nr:DUF453-domain-containing protein [Mollisia scopiformis]KUJ15898.1 DUF453-domain-containing protein [Mollisia scopiformis]